MTLSDYLNSNSKQATAQLQKSLLVPKLVYNMLISISVLMLLPNYAGAKNMQMPVSCVTSGKVDAGLEELVCAEFKIVLKRTYPNFSFVSIPQIKLPSLILVIDHATKQSLGLQLRWKQATNKVIESELMSASSSDRPLNSNLRHALYSRVLAAAPMPKLN
jgi:hypothetical protein